MLPVETWLGTKATATVEMGSRRGRGREGGREAGRKGEREGRREERMEGGSESGREEEREGVTEESDHVYKHSQMHPCIHLMTQSHSYTTLTQTTIISAYSGNVSAGVLANHTA